MTALTDQLIHEFETAVEVKDPASLRRYTQLLLESMLPRSEHTEAQNRVFTTLNELKSDVRVIAERMEQGFSRMDERFEAVDKRFEAVDKRFEAVDKRFEAIDKRFEDMNKRFTDLTVFITIIFTITSALMALLRIFG